MNSLKLALICSGMPGFVRAAASALASRFRFLECYTLAEASQLSRMHQPQLVLIDARSLSESRLTRLQALIESRCGAAFVVVAREPIPMLTSLPSDLKSRVRVLIQESQDCDLGDVIANAISPPTPAEDEEDIDATEDTDEAGSIRFLESWSSSRRSNRVSSRNSAPGDKDCVADACESASGRPNGRESDHASADADKPSMADRFRTRTPELRHMLRRLEVAARHNVTLLLIGETGSGKTHLASLIHELSGRNDQPFLHVACGALPGDLIESELFGHVKGAFTSAHADKSGKFVAAGTGTILLDEIDVLTPDQQVKLLRVIETGEFEPVGSNDTQRLKARVIAASNLQLQPLVGQGRFRPDLYYRLNTLSFAIPPLRKRLPDIEPLARYFVHLHASQFGIDVVEIAAEFIDCLLQYPWPGNVREMENAIRSAVIYSADGRLTPQTLPGHIVDGQAGPGSDPSVTAFFAVREGDTLEERIGLTEKDIIEQALFNNDYSRTNTARHLGISRVTLYNKMRKHGIVPEK